MRRIGCTEVVLQSPRSGDRLLYFIHASVMQASCIVREQSWNRLERVVQDFHKVLDRSTSVQQIACGAYDVMWPAWI